MKEPFITWFAFFVAFNGFSQLTYGNNRQDGDKIDIENQPWKTNKVRLLREGGWNKWRDEFEYNTSAVLNDSPKVVQDKVNEKSTDHSKNLPSNTPNVAIRPRNLLHKKYIDGFKRVLQNRLKIKPRQEIEFLDDNQVSEGKQDEYETPRYEDVNGNEFLENSDNDRNNYVTVIDNVDRKADTDSYSTLTSDAAKSEYTNVESSINEGANEESQMLGEEVNNLLGALTKSDSRINEVVAGGKKPEEGNDSLSYKQTGTTVNNGVTIMDNSKGEHHNSQHRPVVPPKDVTIIEDQEDVNGNADSAHPVLSKAVWDVIQQVEKNLTDQDQNEQAEHIAEDLQSGNAGNKSRWLGYSLVRQNASKGNNIKHPSGHLADLESTLHMFAGFKNQSEYDNVKKKPENVQNDGHEQKLLFTGDAEEGFQGSSINSQIKQSSPYLKNENVQSDGHEQKLLVTSDAEEGFQGSSINSQIKQSSPYLKNENVQSDGHEQKLLVAGDAEEGSQGASINSQIKQSLPYFNQLKNGDISRNKSNAYEQNGNLKPKSWGGSYISFNNSVKAPIQMEKSGGNNLHIQPMLFGLHTKLHLGQGASELQEGKTGQKNETDYQRQGDEMPFPLASKWRSKVGIMEKGRPANNVISSNGRLTQYAQNTNDDGHDEGIAQSKRPYFTPNASSFRLSGAPIFNIPIQPKDVKIIYVNPVQLGSSRKHWQANRTSSSQNDGFSKKPYTPQDFQSQSYQHNVSAINVHQHPGATLPWAQQNHVSDVGTPLNKTLGSSVNAQNATIHMQYVNRKPGHEQTLGSSVNAQNATIQMQYVNRKPEHKQTLGSSVDAQNATIQMQFVNRKPGHEQATVIVSNENEQASFSSNRYSQKHQEGSDGLSEQNNVSSQRVDTSPSLSSWSAEYKKLVEKLRELYGQAHGSTQRATGGTSYNNNSEMNDVEKMMREVSRFHTLFVGQNNGKKGNGNFGEEKEMFFKALKGDVRERISKNVEMMKPLDYLPYLLNRKNYNSSPKASIQNNFGTLFSHRNKDVTGEVRSIEEPIQTSVTASNASMDTNMGSAVNANNTERPTGEPNMTYVNQRLASRQRSTDGIRPSNSTEIQAPTDSNQSSHQVLMTYFGNETVLRKQLHNISDILRMNGFAVGQTTEIEGKEEPLGNSTSGAATESTGIEKNLSNGGGDATKNITNDTILPWPSQVKNVSKEEEEESLEKYIADFISMLSPNNTMNTENLNESVGGSSNSSVSKPNMDTVTPSDASKKENVTDFSNRVIIVVSPQSLKDLMRNRSHSSSMLVMNQVRPIPNDKAENSTSSEGTSISKTVVNVQGHAKSFPGKTTTSNQVSKQMPLNINNATSRKETAESENKDADLNLLYKEELKSLEISLSQDFMSRWIYYQKSLDEIGITPNMLRSGIANLGSPQRLKKVFKKALNGTNINVLVVGGSISAGGGVEKDRGNIEGVYHKAFSDWWNNTVTPITTSQLKIDAVAIGGTDSEYFSYCIKNYMRTLPDIVIWELAANDYQRYKGRNFAPAKPLEQLTRIILNLPSHPALILANFFRGNYYRTTLGQDCPDSEDEGGNTIAQYYKLTSLSWRNVICSSVADQQIDLKKLFSSDGYHPSILGHAQMSTLLISYLKGVFEQTISYEMTLSRNQTLQNHQQDEEFKTLPKPIFDDPENPRPFCWTLLTPDYGKKLRNTLPDLEFTEATGFQFANISHWPVRRDRLRCLKAMQTGAMLKMKFTVPSLDDLDNSSPSSERELAITTHNSFGGMGTVWVDGNQQSAKIIKEQGGQRRTQVDILTRTLAPGVHTVTVSALQPGFCLSAVAVL